LGSGKDFQKREHFYYIDCIFELSIFYTKKRSDTQLSQNITVCGAHYYAKKYDRIMGNWLEKNYNEDYTKCRVQKDIVDRAL
jgi:hypothetical protein